MIRPYVKDRVGVVSSFFSMTFLFESIKLLREFLFTVKESLEEGGYFIGTMMSGEKTYEFLKRIPFNGTTSIGTDVSFIKQYENKDFETGMKLHINIKNTIVGAQDEYLAFFSILKEECEKLGLKNIKTFDFIPSEKYNMTPDEIQFSRLNIGFVFQKCPNKFHYETQLIPVDKTFQFMNLYKEEQLLVRTGVDENYSFYRSYLYNKESSYRPTQENKDIYRETIASRLFAQFQDVTKFKAKENMPLEDIETFMFSQDINIYLIDSITRRPIYMEGYNVSRTSMMMVYHSDKGKYEPLAVNIKNTAIRMFGPLDHHIAMVHRAMKRDHALVQKKVVPDTRDFF
jgi:hypothetical protein